MRLITPIVTRNDPLPVGRHATYDPAHHREAAAGRCIGHRHVLSCHLHVSGPDDAFTLQNSLEGTPFQVGALLSSSARGLAGHPAPPPAGLPAAGPEAAPRTRNARREACLTHGVHSHRIACDVVTHKAGAYRHFFWPDDKSPTAAREQSAAALSPPTGRARPNQPVSPVTRAPITRYERPSGPASTRRRAEGPTST
jgi:hypothetical protein